MKNNKVISALSKIRGNYLYMCLFLLCSIFIGIIAIQFKSVDMEYYIGGIINIYFIIMVLEYVFLGLTKYSFNVYNVPLAPKKGGFYGEYTNAILKVSKPFLIITAIIWIPTYFSNFISIFLNQISFFNWMVTIMFFISICLYVQSCIGFVNKIIYFTKINREKQ